MNRELYMMFLRRHWRIAAITGAGSGLLVLFLIALFPGMGGEDAIELGKSWPAIAVTLFGDPVQGFSEIHAWANLQFFHIAYWVILAFLAAILGASIVAREIEEKALDILLSCPVNRTELLVSRMAAVVTLLVAAALAVFLGSALGISGMGHAPRLGALAAVTLNGLLLACFSGAMTLLISIVFPNRLLSAFSAVGVLAAFFLFDELLVPLLRIEAFAPAGLFRYYAAGDILVRGEVSPLHPAVLAAAALAVFLAATALFRNRDLPV